MDIKVKMNLLKLPGGKDIINLDNVTDIKMNLGNQIIFYLITDRKIVTDFELAEQAKDFFKQLSEKAIEIKEDYL